MEMAQTKLDSTATETLVSFLNKRFWFNRRLRCLVSFTGRKERGHYKPGHRLIVVAKHVPVWIVCHEFAHHLDRCVNGKPRSEWHSDSFYRNLRRVVEAAGIEGYPWSIEYLQVRRWAKRDGLY